MRHQHQWLSTDKPSHLAHQSVWKWPMNMNHVVLSTQRQPARINASNQNVRNRQQLHVGFANFVSRTFFMSQRFDTRWGIPKTLYFDSVERMRLEPFVSWSHHRDFVAFFLQLAVNFSHPWNGIVRFVPGIGGSDNKNSRFWVVIVHGSIPKAVLISIN